MTPSNDKNQAHHSWKTLPTGGFFVATLAVLLLAAPLFTALDTRLRDYWSRLRLNAAAPSEHPLAAKLGNLLPKPVTPGPVVLVLADDRSILGIHNLYQGNRQAYADVVRIIASAGARVIAIDTFFGTLSGDANADEELAEAVSEAGNVVLKAFRRGPETMTTPYPTLARAGHVAPSYFSPLVDETIRRSSAIFRPVRGQPVPGFHAEIVRIWLGLPLQKLSYESDQLTFKAASAPISIPLSNREHTLINYNFDPQAVTRVSLYDVKQGSVAPAVFRDKIVIIGPAHSMSEERLFTPLGKPEFPPFIHAVVVSNYLDGTTLTPAPPWQAPLAAAIVLAIVSFMLAPRLQPFAFGVISLAGTIGLFALSAVAFFGYGRIVDVTSTVAALDLTFFFAVGMRYYAEQSDKLRIKNAFQHYVTASIVNEILKDPAKLNLHGEERCLSLFFSDIEGFTTLSEGLSPLIVVNLLNEYLTEMTDIIFKYDGLLDKYEGDAIMAVFGAPVDQADHAIRACRCALDSQKALSEMRARWRKEGKPELFVRIGINTGVVVVGNMGSRMRFDYTCIGDNVNLAARLETANKMFGTSILISGDTADLVKPAILCRFLGMIRVVGRKQAVPVYEVLARLDGHDGGDLELQQHRKKTYEDALQMALNRNFAGAIMYLTQYMSADVEDRPARLLLERCKSYAAAPPPPDWDGIMIQEQK